MMTQTPPPPLHAVRARPRFQMARTIMALVLREMATTYGKSAGGYLWALLDPILGIALLSVVFSLAVRHPPIGDNFPLFYASGYLPFTMFNNISQKVARSVAFSKPFLAYPAVTFMDALLARLLLNGVTDIVVCLVVVFGIFFIFDLPVYFDTGAFAMTMGLIIFFGAGVGVLNCFLMTSFPVYERMWSIAIRPLFLISGVFFTYHSMPPVAQNILWYNPVLQLVGLMRAALYPAYDSSYISIWYIVGISGVLLFIGLLLLVRHFKRLMES